MAGLTSRREFITQLDGLIHLLHAVSSFGHIYLCMQMDGQTDRQTTQKVASLNLGCSTFR